MRVPPDGTDGLHGGQLDCSQILAWGRAHHYAWVQLQALQVCSPPKKKYLSFNCQHLSRLGQSGEQELVDSKDDLPPNEVISKDNCEYLTFFLTLVC